MSDPKRDPFLELKHRFLAGLERRLAELRDLLDGGAAPEMLMLKFHSLAGIGGTYGFDRITDLSRQSEQLCATVVDEKRALRGNELEELANGIMAIRVAAAAPQTSSNVP